MFGEQIVKGGIGTRTILKIENYIENSKYESKLVPFKFILVIMKTDIGSEHRLIHVLQETIHCILYSRFLINFSLMNYWPF